ncbi:MAG TPA: DoxX family protein [Bacteroidales bacterium]|nr:DoxX family protein [Bacteroidales bacterium]
MKLKLFSIPVNPARVDLALLLIRMVAGLSFAFYGSFKIKDPLHWMGPDSGYPAFFQMLAAISEFCGGIAWIIGFLTPLASFGIACTMTVATYTHISGGDPFVSFTGGGAYDHPLLFLVIAVMLLLSGPGRFSTDRIVFGERKQSV